MNILKKEYEKSMKGKCFVKTQIYESPCGLLMLGSLDGKLCLCDWHREELHDTVCQRLKRELKAEFEMGETEVTTEAVRELKEYFDHQRQEFDVPLLLVGTDFQKTVWRALMSIPYGKTASYGELARRIGRAEAVRAVANAIGANALSVFVPCHRVIGSNGSLTGFRGGIEAKRWLLGNVERTNSAILHLHF